MRVRSRPCFHEWSRDKMEKIFIVDDESRIRRMLTDFLNGNGYETIEGIDGRDALEVFYANNTEIDLILLDVMMPEKNGYQVLKEIREISNVPVIMLTARSEEEDQLICFKGGADDFVAKPFSPSLLLAHIEAVLKRCIGQRERPIEAGAVKVDTEKMEVKAGEEIIELTPKEYDLLLYFLQNENVVLTRETILDAVWSFDYMGDIRTVDTHVKQLRFKLGIWSRYIKTVHGVGYKLEVEDVPVN